MEAPTAVRPAKVVSYQQEWSVSLQRPCSKHVRLLRSRPLLRTVGSPLQLAAVVQTHALVLTCLCVLQRLPMLQKLCNSAWGGQGSISQFLPNIVAVS